MTAREKVIATILAAELKTGDDYDDMTEAIQTLLDGYGQSGGPDITYGYGLKLEDNVLSVDAATEVEEDNTKPITSAAVFTEVGNIHALLQSI